MAIVQEREEMYSLIIGQLRSDGFADAAKMLSEKVLGGKACAPSERLARITELGVQSEGRQQALDDAEGIAVKPEFAGLDFDNGNPAVAQAVTLVPVELYQTKHRGEVRAACFSKDGSFAATADVAALVKIYSVQKILAIGDGEAGASDGSPVIRTIGDQKKAINDIAFHPDAPVFVAASQDCTISFYDFHKPNPIRPSRTIQESHNVRSFAIHPAGTFLLAGTDHPILRVYDINTAQCYATQNALEHHTAPVAVVRYNGDGRQYASGCKGGQLKLWDGISGRCVNTFHEAHQGAALSSLQFSKNGNYLLSGGQDSVVRLWDLRTGKVLMNYMGATSTEREIQSCFSEDELTVYSIDETTNGVCSWDASTGYNFTTGKKGGAGHCLAHSPTHKLLLGGGGDGKDAKARFWALRTHAEEDAADAADAAKSVAAGAVVGDGVPAPAVDAAAAASETKAAPPSDGPAGDMDAYKQFLESTAAVVQKPAIEDTPPQKRDAEVEIAGASKKPRTEEGESS